MSDSTLLVEESSPSCVQKWRVVGNSLQRSWLTRRWNLASFFRSAFLPAGYPDSVSSDYWDYQKWDTLQALCSTLTGLLCTKAILTGVGVGDVNATAASATVQWILRDATGMLSSILFAWSRGRALDYNAKTWRFVADILNDVAMGVELISPLVPRLFLLLVCVASLMKAVVGVAGGCTRAAITMHQARVGNMADVSAKDGSQETAVNLVGMGMGLLLLWMLKTSQYLTWAVYFLLTALHLTFNYLAIRAVVLDFLNDQRCSLVIRHYLRCGIVLTPVSISKLERVLVWEARRVAYGMSLKKMLENRTPDSAEAVLKTFSSLNYVLDINSKSQNVNVFLKRDATDSDILQAAFHAEILRNRLNRFHSENIATCIMHSRTRCIDEFPPFWKAVQEAGWKSVRLTTGDWRITSLQY